MELNVKWHAPIKLIDGNHDNLIYTAEGLEDWAGMPGVYMFARIFNGKVYPLYIGKTESLGARALQHFKKSTQLMIGIQKARNGTKVLIFGQFTPRSGQSTAKCIGLIERALIDHALTEGHTLLNVQGTRTRSHTVNFSGHQATVRNTGKNLSFRATT
ncbi:hypothetical protein [Stenotrophomonas sp.]|uniref:hypothetical protein n=1 Tax=Stenotrophomonas sp. TaxID=69392 RepID=UPI002D55EC0A|nr:hypothetical protein [Stenotrophomonas sp.]HYQ23301.1 hypothetical protein [Stenotrophomonas sp.]